MIRCCACPLCVQIRAEKAPSMDLEDMQKQSVEVIQHLHHDAEQPQSSAEVGALGFTGLTTVMFTGATMGAVAVSEVDGCSNCEHTD